jgi:type IV pilus assembly protein PilV
MKHRMQGSSLIEVLVALLISSIGVLAMTGLSGVALRYMRSGEFRIEATLLASDLADRIRANRSGLMHYAQAPAALTQQAPEAAASCATEQNCTAQELAAIDLATWQRSLFNHLPQGTGFVQVLAAPASRVAFWVLWREPAALSGGAGAAWGHYLNPGEAEQSCPPGFNNQDPQPRCLFFQIAL